MNLKEALQLEPQHRDEFHIRKVVEALSFWESGELFFEFSRPFFIKHGNTLQKLELFAEEDSLGSIEEDQTELIAELLARYRDKSAVPLGIIDSSIEFSFEIEDKKLKVKIESCSEKTSLFVTVRLYKQFPYALQGLGFEKRTIENLRSFTRGLIIITGPPSSGKTTTALSLIHEIASLRSIIAYTYERPIEVSITSSRAVIIQKGYGTDFNSWGELQKERRSPASAVYIADVSEREAAELALDFASAGKLVIITITGDSTFATLQNLESLFLAEERPLRRGQLAFSFQAIIYQNLVKSQSPNNPFILAYEVIFASDRNKALIAEGKYNLVVPDTQSNSPDIPYRLSLRKLLQNNRITRKTYQMELDRYYKGQTLPGGKL